jgi:uncharacterized protein (TIGR02611 family)
MLRYNTLMDWFKKGWSKTPTKVRKPFVFVLGFTVVAVGIALIPLPGPGWAIVFAGFAILATEFEFAERVRDKLIFFLKKLINYFEPAWRRLVKSVKRRLKN